MQAENLAHSDMYRSGLEVRTAETEPQQRSCRVQGEKQTIVRMTANVRGRRVVESMGSTMALPEWEAQHHHSPGTHGKLQNFLYLCVLINNWKVRTVQE